MIVISIEIKKKERPLLVQINITINNRLQGSTRSIRWRNAGDSDLGAKDKWLLVTALILRSASPFFSKTVFCEESRSAAHCDRHNLRFQKLYAQWCNLQSQFTHGITTIIIPVQHRTWACIIRIISVTIK